MENQKHTPEPWVFTMDDFEILSGEVEVANLLTADGNQEQRRANAARIVACVNAMKGKPNPERWMQEAEAILLRVYEFQHPQLQLGDSKIEKMYSLIAERDELAKKWEIVKHLELDAYHQMKAQRDELLKVLKEAFLTIEDFGTGHHCYFKVRDAIVKAEGGTRE